MAEETKTYAGHLLTGSSSWEVTLELDADTARIALTSRWMGQDDDLPQHVDLRFRHHPGPPHHGLLELVDADLPLPSADDEETFALLPLIVEYLKVPATVVHRHPESALHGMRQLGFAVWSEEFDLVLLTDDEGWPEDQPWSHIRQHLDKAKLRAVTPSR